MSCLQLRGLKMLALYSAIVVGLGLVAAVEVVGMVDAGSPVFWAVGGVMLLLLTVASYFHDQEAWALIEETDPC